MRLKLPLAVLLVSISLTFGCQNNIFQPQNTAPPAMRDVPSVRLNYKYEADVPAPASNAGRYESEERHAAVQAEFDANRPLELLDQTISSPDKKKILAVYHRISDAQDQDGLDVYRLDMYSAEGSLIKKLTPETMAVYFPETIVWSPDSNSLAFVAKTRAAQAESETTFLNPTDGTASNSEIESNSNVTANSTIGSTKPSSTPASPTGILTFRTQQIYVCNADGNGLKALTENEGLIYFYYAWSPDSSMLAALATTAREWKYQEISTDSKGEMMVPSGRLRIIEKNGRERRLDDGATAVHPIWSPDSAKVAVAFDTQIRIYDAGGTNPTQAAIPLRNQLLISSQAYDREQQRQAQLANTDAEVLSSTSATPNQPLTTLPDEKLLVSYNPIVELAWRADDLIYLKTAFVRRPINDLVGVTSFARWHRLALTSQLTASPR